MTTRVPREAAVVARLLKYLASLPHSEAEKNAASYYGNQGKPDIYACIAGRMIVLEAKRPGEDATPLQLMNLAKWDRAGALTGVVHSVDELKALLTAAKVIS